MEKKIMAERRKPDGGRKMAPRGYVPGGGKSADGEVSGRARQAGSRKNSSASVSASGRRQPEGRGNGSTGVPASGCRQVWRAGNMLYPVPAVMVSCGRDGEKPNILTVAWAGTVCSDPAMVSISVRKSRCSHDIIGETGEFVINLVTEELTKACDWCGVRSGRDVDKFAYTWQTEDGRQHRLTAGRASKLEHAPVILESPVSIECRVKQVIPLESHDMFLADVVCVDADEAYFDEKGRFDLDRARLIAYSHGEYFGLGRKIGTFGYSVKKRGK